MRARTVRRPLGIITLIGLVATGCDHLTDPTHPPSWSAEANLTTGGGPLVTTAYGGGLYMPAHLACVGALVQSGSARWGPAYRAVRGVAASQRGRVAHPSVAFSVPSYYAAGASAYWRAVQGLTYDADAAYELAVIYSITGDESYAAPAAAILRAWSTTNRSVSGHDGLLSMTELGVGFILSAELLNPYRGWTPTDRLMFRHWLRFVYYPQAAAPIRDMANNWGDWGVFGAVMTDYYLNYRVRLDSETVRLQHHIDAQIAADGSMPNEAARGPGAEVWYTYYALDPMTAAASVLKNAGEPDLFRWTSPHGHTIRSALDHLLWMTENGSQAGLAVPRAQDSWPADLFEAMADQYGTSSYAAYAVPKRPISYTGHHYAWAFPTLLSAPGGYCP